MARVGKPVNIPGQLDFGIVITNISVSSHQSRGVIIPEFVMRQGQLLQSLIVLLSDIFHGIHVS